MGEKLRMKGQKALLWIAILVILYAMTLLQLPMIIRNLFLVISTSVWLFFIWKDNSEKKWELIILLLGLLARVTFCYLDIYTSFELPIGGGDDGIAFMERAVAYYHGDFSIQYTRYPYILCFIFYIMGINQFAAQYVNILCWCFSAVVLQKSCKKLDISGNLRLLSLSVFSGLPSNIWITSILYRDAYIMLLLFLSFYYLLCWIQEGKYTFIILSVGSVLFATLLHGASIMSLAPIAFVYAFYAQDRKKFCISRKSVLIIAVILSILLTIISIPQLRNIVLHKIPNMSDGLVIGLNQYLEGKYDYSYGAGSNYLEGRYLTGYFDIIVMTIQRIYYHMFSPVPHMWRGITDAIAFVASSAPIYLAAVLLWSASICYKKIDTYRLVLFLETFIVVGVYAWGNVNAGAAIRHREKILCFVILLAAYSCNIIQKRNERKNDEKNTN